MFPKYNCVNSKIRSCYSNKGYLEYFQNSNNVRQNKPLHHLPTEIVEVCCILKSGGQWDETSFPNNLNVRHIITVMRYKTEIIKVIGYLCYLSIPEHVKLSQWYAELKNNNIFLKNCFLSRILKDNSITFKLTLWWILSDESDTFSDAIL